MLGIRMDEGRCVALGTFARRHAHLPGRVALTRATVRRSWTGAVRTGTVGTMRALLPLLLAAACTPASDPTRYPPTEEDSDADGDADEGGELRGLWVTRWSFRDAAQVASIMENLDTAGFNAVFFQVRGVHDALYDPALEPWSAVLGGTLGEDPGWDPLAVAVAEGHARGLQVHAYLNVAPLWSGTAPPPEAEPRHAYLEHPDWLVADASGIPMALDGSYVYASPGNPAVRSRLAAVAADVAGRYAVDGIHLDYLRYPGREYSHDAASEAAYQGSSLSWEAWQRAQVTDAARGVYTAVDVPVTAAVWGIWEDAWGWGGVTEGNVDLYQDSRALLSEGVLDATIPMIYWPVTEVPGDRLDFATLVADHVDHASGRHVYAGIAADLGEEAVEACIRAARVAGARGVVLFDWSTASSAGWLPDLATGVFAEPARVPALPWRD